jgi:tubulin-specific chaperone A
MLTSLKGSEQKNETQDWLKTGQTQLNDKMRGEQEIVTVCRNIITYLAHYLNAQIGAIYLAVEESHHLHLFSSYAFTKRKNIPNTFDFGEGLVGQAALEKKVIHLIDIPDDYIVVSSGLGETPPRNILVLPFILEDKVIGVIELGALEVFGDLQIEFLEQVTEPVAIAVKAAQNRLQMQELLDKTQAQSEALQNQQEELKASNEELEQQTQELEQQTQELEQQTERLKSSEEELQAQHEELEQTNTQLEEKTVKLEEQKEQLEKTSVEVQEKSRDLELSNKYKSEFLSNMSHELRTPLNSLLILSKLLMENDEGNLTAEQIESAKVIYEGGTELLSLINEILDLAKIEAGKMNVSVDDVSVHHLVEDIEKQFGHVAQEKGLELKTHIQDGLPEFIRTDSMRAKQILKNLLSNAFKFTDEGSVTVSISRPNETTNLSYSGLDYREAVAFAVSDTGVGIPKKKQKMIFHAFQQAEGTIDRKYGGTGLGLSISREISRILGGEIQLASEEGIGSMFTLYLPEKIEGSFTEDINSRADEKESRKKQVAKKEDTNKDIQLGKEIIPDDRSNIAEDDKVVLIIEDDARFAKILADISHKKDFKCLVAGDGETGLKFAGHYKPEAIILDVGLPGKDGFDVIDELKDNPATRHIPVHFISAQDEPQSQTKALSMGAIGYTTKPASTEQLNDVFNHIQEFLSSDVKKLLIAEDDTNTRESIVKLIGSSHDIEIAAVGTGQEAYDLLKTEKFDCMVLDLGLPDMTGFELLSKMKNNDDISTKPPVVIYSGKDLSRDETTELREYAGSVIVKGAESPARLLDETSLFLHQVESSLPPEQQRMIRMAHDKESILQGKNILIVDDDMRNVFALSHALTSKGMTVLRAENGQKALEVLEANQNIDIVLMDIMMPVMDGYETIKKIREQEKYWKLPILALTAKAMKGDREKCIEAGANDYLAKPVDIEKVFSMLRVWLYV